MAFKSRPIVIGTSDTLIYECPASLEAAGKISVSNVSGTAATLTVKFYDASTAQTVTVIAGQSIAANSSFALPSPPSWEQGDAIYMQASAGSALVALATITESGLSPSAVGFIPSGAYAAGTTYGVGALVSLDGASYLSRVAGNLGNNPPASPAQWQLVSAKGNPGQDGADGDLTSANFANDAQMRSAAASRLVTADKIETASAWVTITYGATITLNWDNFINGVATLTGNPTFAAPTNLQDGVERCLLLKGNNATERVPAFNTVFKGDLPEDGATSTQWLLLTLKPSGSDILVSHIVVDAS